MDNIDANKIQTEKQRIQERLLIEIDYGLMMVIWFYFPHRIPLTRTVCQLLNQIEYRNPVNRRKRGQEKN